MHYRRLASQCTAALHNSAGLQLSWSGLRSWKALSARRTQSRRKLVVGAAEQGAALSERRIVFALSVFCAPPAATLPFSQHKGSQERVHGSGSLNETKRPHLLAISKIQIFRPFRCMCGLSQTRKQSRRGCAHSCCPLCSYSLSCKIQFSGPSSVLVLGSAVEMSGF